MDVHEFLFERGYQGPVEDRLKGPGVVYFHRRTPGAKHQWVVYEHTVPWREDIYKSYTVEMVYRARGDVWTEVSFYSLRAQDITEKLPDLEARLVAAIPAMGGNPLSYEDIE